MSSPERVRKAKGGLSKAEREKMNRETGSNLKAPQPEGGPRKDSYCARSAGIKKCKDPDSNGIVRTTLHVGTGSVEANEK